jgi:hypothetical protein
LRFCGTIEQGEIGVIGRAVEFLALVEMSRAALCVRGILYAVDLAVGEQLCRRTDLAGIEIGAHAEEWHRHRFACASSVKSLFRD